MTWALIYGLSKGDPYKLITLYDYDGNGCGYTSGAKDYKYMYWPIISSSYTSVSYKAICVNKCPTIASPLTSTDCKTNSIYSSCPTTIVYDSVLYLSKF